VRGIPSQLTQLFQNLISNSLKFNRSAPVINISCGILTETERKEIPELNLFTAYLKIVFADNGIGFEQHYADKIFTIFQRLHTSGEYAGTGIGLALCKRIVENHHGLISVASVPDTGTSFYIYLPHF